MSRSKLFIWPWTKIDKLESDVHVNTALTPYEHAVANPLDILRCRHAGKPGQQEWYRAADIQDVKCAQKRHAFAFEH